MPDALRDDDPEGKMRPERVPQHCLLPDEKRPRTMKHENSLLVGALDRHKPHVRPSHCLANRLRIRKSRKVRIDCAASDPFTTHEVFAAVHGTLLWGKCVVVQRYGETNRELHGEGAGVTEIVTYHWGLPEDTAPLLRLIGALGRDEIDLVAFTSASQASNLFTVAQHDGKEASLK